jgi:hypothetical protein
LPAAAPARNVEESIVEREVEIGDERWNRAEALEKRRQIIGGRRLGGNLNRLVYGFGPPDPEAKIRRSVASFEALEYF